MMRAVSKAMLLASAALLAISPAAGQAARGATDSTKVTVTPPDTGVAEILVTAQRREESLQNVPIAVTALSAARIADAGIREGRDLERFVPSLKMTPNITSPTNLSPSLRGSTTQDASLFVAESPFGIYIDDIFVGRLNGNNTTLNDVERVEVLRGPQGTLYGRNTLAGAIKFITRTPGQDNSWTEAQVGYGNYNQYIASGSVGAPINSTLAASASAQFNGRDGFGKNVATGRTFGSENNFAARIKLHYTGIEKLDVVGWVSYADSSNDGATLVAATTPNVPANQRYGTNDLVPKVDYYSVNVPVGPTGPGPIRSTPYGKTKQTIASLQAAYDLGGMTLKSIFGYVRTDDAFSADLSGSGLIYAGSKAYSDQFTEEVQLQGKLLDDKLNFLAGVYYLNEKTFQNFGWIFFTPASQTFSPAKTESISGFGQATYAVTDNFKLTAGIRYSHDSKRFNESFQALPTILIPPGPQPDVNLRVGYGAWTPKFAVDFGVPTSGGLINKLLIYGSAARGFRSGGFNGIEIFSLADARTPYFPETNWTYEAGVKTDLLDRRLRVNAAYFIDNISNLILNATIVDPATGTSSFPSQNAGSATIKGLELEVNAVAVKGLNLFATTAFLQGHFHNLNPGSAPASSLTLYNAAPQTPQIPAYTVTTGFDYTADLARGSKDAKFRLGADYSRSGSYIVAATNDFRVDAYSRINAFVALGLDERYEARLTVKNLEDKRSFITGSRALGGFIALPPRTFLATLSYKM